MIIYTEGSSNQLLLHLLHLEIKPSRSMNKATLSVSSLLLLLLIIHVLVETVASEPRAQIVVIRCSPEREENTTEFPPNFVGAMESISDQMRVSGFGLAVIGRNGPNRNYGLAQCYGDLTLLDCVLCYAEARARLPGCFPNNGGVLYLDGCFMRLQNYSFFQEVTGPQDKTICANKTHIGSIFEASTRKAIKDAIAVAPHNINRYASTQVLAGNDSTYVLANCWRTLNASSCKVCLENASERVAGCLPQSEGRALNTGCYMRYSDRNFLNAAQQSGGSNVSKKVIIAIVVSSVGVVVIGIAIGVYVRKHTKLQEKRRGLNNSVDMAKLLHDSSLNFKYSTLQKATNSFDEANKLGQGGYGTVYKGVLADGREIAVKRLFHNNRQRAADFYNEVNIISTVDHKNLVRLLGCSCFGPESLLVYEFLPNKSLDQFIFDANKGKALSWEKRQDIIIGTAEGLAYLHENNNNRIIHRDIKASNVLLDAKLRAKIADFGLARTFQADKTHISTAIAGTLGYMAPEYLAHGQLTEKADVYSFGVLVLEIVTGRQNNKSKNLEYSDSLVIAAWRHFQQGKTEELFDPNLMLQNYKTSSDIRKEIVRVVNVGLLCTQEIPSLRPSMSRALQMLLKKDEQLPSPTNPPFMDEKTMELCDTSEDPSQRLNTNSPISIASISHSAFYPR